MLEIGNPSATSSNYDEYRDNLPHGILGFIGGSQLTGALRVTNSGDITLGGPYVGILMQSWGNGGMTLDNSGDIGAVAGQTVRRGIQFDLEYWDNQNTRAITLTNSGDITAADFGIRLKKLTGGTIALTNRGAITVTGDAAQHLGHAIYLVDNFALDAGRTYATNSGDVTVVNEGALNSKNHALYVYKPTTTTANVADDFELTNSGAITSQEGDGIRIERPDGTGAMTVDNSGAITAGVNAIWIDEILTPATTGTVSVTHSAGALSAGRSGIVVQVTSSNTAATVTPRSSSAPQPLIDVAWGSTASSGATARGTTGTAANDNGRFATVGAGNAGARQVLTFDQEAEGSKGSGGVYGGPAGIEAYAISWRDVVEQVALGDYQSAITTTAQQTTAVPTGATAADNAHVAQFRAALENAEIAVAPALLTAIGTTATTAASDLTDAQIVAFLRVDNAGRRALLRDVLGKGLTDGEKAILRALATGGDVDAALTAAGHTDDTSDDGDYWSLVKALLARYNVGDIHVNVHSGSITASRGDGIRAYYATPNDNNGAIDVTIAAGASVAGAGTGIYVANAGGDVTVESGGTIRGGTDGIRVIKPGTMGDLTITTTAGSSITATTGAGIHPQDNAGHTGTVTVTNAGDVTGGTWGILANRLGAGTVSVTSSGGTVWGMTEPGIFAANKAGDASDLSVEVTGGAVRSSGRNKHALHAHNRGTGDLSVTLGTGVGAISKHGAGVFASLGNAYSTTSQVDVTQGGPIQGRTGVYVRVAQGTTAATATARAAGAQPLIDVTWTGSFSHGTAPAVAQNDNDRFAAASVADVLSFDQEAAAVKALDGSLRYGGAAGVDAHALSWRDVVAQVAKGDDPGAIADATAQQTAVPTGATASDNDYVKQLRAALGNDDLAVAEAVFEAIDPGSSGPPVVPAATSLADVTDAEIVAYLRTDSAATRALLQDILAKGLSDKEKAVLRAVAMNDGLATALADADAAFSTAYKNAVNALLNLYNVGDIRVAMNGGSITATRGDGIRAWYATPNANNGAITVTVASGARVTAGKAGVYVANSGGAVEVSHSGTITGGTYGIYVANTAGNGAIEVTVAADASVTGATAGVYVANASDGLMLARKYTYGFAMGQMADTVVAVTSSGGDSLLDQVVTVAGTVTGGTDAGVRLSGGAVIVMEGGSVRAGSSGVGILADGAALVYVDGEVRGGAGGAAAVHLSGGGDVTVGLNGRVRANGATHAIQSDGAGTDRLTLITSTTIPYRDDLLAQVDGSLSGIDSARLVEHQNGAPTGYSLTLGITSDGMLDTSKLPSRPTSYDCTTNGRCRITQAGTVSSRRTGVYAAVPSTSATVASQPLIDVTWTARFTQGAVSSAAVRIAAATARDALVADRESAAGKAVAETVHWGGPAGIEAHALSWREVAEQVAKGDDPGAIANNAAQLTAVPTGATASDNDYVKQFRAALENGDLTVASAVLVAIGTTATTAATALTDAQIVTYLQADDDATRALLRNVLAQGLSDKEKAVLAAVAAGDTTALTTALNDADAAFSSAYKNAVNALLNRSNVGNIRVRMNGGSIVSRGDGIRAYYATPHATNGAIEVTVAAGASVTADRAGIYVANAGGAVTVTNGGTITADTYGIHVVKPGTSGDVTITSTGGSITADTQAGIYVTNAGGAVEVESGGTIRAGTHGIHVADAGGAVTVTNAGTVTADTSDTHGIYVADADGAVTVTNSGTVTADTYGIHVVKAGASGDVTITTTGGSITATATDGIGIYPQDHPGHTGTVTVSNGGDVTAPTWGIYANRLGSGAVSVTNTGGTVRGMTEPGIFAANKLDDASTVTVRVTGGTVRSEGPNKPAIRAWNRGTGDLDLTIAAGATAISKHAAGVFAPLGDAAGNQVEIAQGGTIMGRTGVYAQVAHGTTAATPPPRSAQPLIGVTWTGAFSHGTTATVAPDDNGRFAAATAGEALAFDREAAAVKALEGSLHYGGAAGIEAHVLSWRDVVAEVAKGDDPGAFANNAAQLTAVPTGATAGDNAYVAQLRAALDNDDLAVASAVFEAIDSTATSLDDVTDAEIVTYLREDDADIRTLLRNILAQGLSDAEKAVLRAVATGDGVDAALDDADAGFSNDYKTAVRALLDRYNVGDIRIAMNGGSIDSRGDGIRAYYATPNENNGAISVTIAEGARVTAGKAGIYVANAGGAVTVTNGGTVRAGTDGIHVADAGGGAVTVSNSGTVRAGADGIRVVKPGTSGDLTITTTGGSITATAGAGIHPQDNAGHTGTVTVTNAGDVTGGTWGIYANRLGAGTVSVTSSGGTVWGMTEPGIFAANKEGDASDLSVEVAGGAVRSAGRNKPAIHAWNRGTGDLAVAIAAGAGAISKHAAGVFASLGDTAGNWVEITQGGTIEGRTGVYARVAHGTTAATPPSRSVQPLIGVTWTGAFSHGTTADVAPNDDGRFQAATAGEVLAFDRETVAVKAVEETIRWDAPAGIEAQVMSWRHVASVVAAGDDPGEIADDAARALVFDTSDGADADLKARSDALVRQAKAVLDNDEITVEAGSALAAVIAAVDADNDGEYTEEEIASYLARDDNDVRTGLQTFMAQGLSDGEKAVLAAVAAGDGDGVDAALRTAGFDPDDDEDYWSRVKALLERYNVGDIRIAVNGGSIGSIDSPARGDGIRAYYATPHASNGGISVTVAEGASVTGAMAGVYVANAGPGLMLARKYTPGYAPGDAPEELVEVMHGEGEDAEPLRNQLVTVAGTVTGGTDAAVHLNGGGAVIVMEGGKVHAGDSGVGILVNDPGPAVVYINGEVKGKATAEGMDPAAAVHLSGGGSVIVGPDGKVQANGAAHAIRGGGDEATTVTLVTERLDPERLLPYREDVNAQVDGSIEDAEGVVRLREDRAGVPTGYSLTLTVGDDGLLDTSKLPSRPVPPTEPPVSCPADGRCRITQAGTISGRTGVYAAVPRASAEGETRAASAPPLIEVIWTGTFSHGEGSSDEGRFEAETVWDVLAFDREAAAGQAVEEAETVRWDAPAGIEAHALSWREVAEEVAKGDDPGAIADNAAQMNLLSETHADSERAAIVAQFRAALGNDEIAVAAAVLTAIDSTATTVADLSDTEIVTYLGTDDGVTRALLRDVLAQGLSDGEEEVLKAVAAGDGDGVDAALTAAGFTDDTSEDDDYWSKVKGLLERYNVGDIRIAVNGGSIGSIDSPARGDGIRAYYATPHAMNGGIDVTVAAGTTVTGAMAGIYVANAGEGLRIPKRYAPEAIRDLEANKTAGEDDPIAIGRLDAAGEAIETPYLNQLVTVAGTVIGGTDAAVHLNGGGAVIVMKEGKVHAGDSGVAILVNDPGPAHLFIDGEVKGKASAEGTAPAAAVDLPGGGSFIVGLNGRVQANGAALAIRGGDTDETLVALTLATDSMMLYREDAEEAYARVGGFTEGVEPVVRLSEYQNDAPSGYSTPLTVAANGMLDTSGLDPRPEPGDDGSGDGEPKDGEPGDGEPGDGEPGDGEPKDGEPKDDRPGDDGSGRGPGMVLSCEAVERLDRRCRLYEALPSVLLAMNALPSYAERMSAARDGNGGWASVEAARGEWQAKTATMGGKLAYDHRRSAVRAGVDFLAGESGRVGVSMHALQGKAEMGGVGEVELDGMGGGLSATWLVGDFYVDAQAAVTLYDVDVESYTHGKMPKKDVYGAGYGLGVDVGRRMSVGGMFVTPRAGVGWSKVDLDGFTDMERYGGPRARVSVEEAVSVKGRLGVMVEMEVGSGETSGQVFGSLDVEGEFSDETEVKVGGQMLKTEVRPTAVRVGLGGVFAVDEDMVVRGTVGYRTSGSGTSGYGGGLELRVRF